MDVFPETSRNSDFCWNHTTATPNIGCGPGAELSKNWKHIDQYPCYYHYIRSLYDMCVCTKMVGVYNYCVYIYIYIIIICIIIIIIMIIISIVVIKNSNNNNNNNTIYIYIYTLHATLLAVSPDLPGQGFWLFCASQVGKSIVTIGRV